MALLSLTVIGSLARFIVPSFRGWYHDDDFENLRWTLEYRYTPWQALTDRHALHDHIRPFSLLALWVGAWMSDGDFWGQHLVEAALAALAVAGAEKILRREVNAQAHADLLGQLRQELR